ncbi:pseudaminic acid synthase [Cohnella ginsengisoli]|uniref:Pseudaminic acid synthase n=1 Tax=Cohnella ginsengisoli TaxID=425004 RepID=A0A9X4QQG6_9BACL|nr:pseudaminic acid synthase [Cohnella ginsengisoli]MDG0794587.1 pseudaminic acid synthase [Cohnella ginsengisoli]
MSIRVGNYQIGQDHPPFIIAEMSGNHNQSLDKALEIVEAAAAAGVQALKIQTYTADTMTLDINTGEFFIDDPQNLWQGSSLYSLYQQAYTPWEWHQAIFDKCKELGIVGFSTPFDESAVDFLESLDVPCYKIASFENTDLPLIRKAAATGKPLIVSTGMATVAELDETVRAAREAGCRDLVLLKCTSSYPSTADDSNLLTIPHMRELFGCEIGLSDHTMGIGVGVASVALGGTVIEKHLTISRAEGGVDSDFSMEPAEMASLVRETEQAWRSLGRIQYGAIAAESASMKHRRSLYVGQDLKEGDIMTKDNIRSIRPGHGLPPKYLDQLLGRPVKHAVKKGTPVSFDLL